MVLKFFRHHHHRFPIFTISPHIPLNEMMQMMKIGKTFDALENIKRKCSLMRKIFGKQFLISRRSTKNVRKSEI